MDKLKFDRFEKYAYSTVYSEPESPAFHTPLIKMAVENFFDKLNLPKNARIFDIGCGQGEFLNQMKAKNYNNTVGITLSREDYQACADKGFNSEMTDMSDLSANDNTVDMIWCRHALEHSPYPFFTLLEFNRVLKTGGYLYVEVPAPELERQHEFNPNHYSVFKPQMWAALFDRAGFSVASFQDMNLHVKAPEKEPIPELFYCFMLNKKNEISYS